MYFISFSCFNTLIAQTDLIGDVISYEALLGNVGLINRCVHLINRCLINSLIKQSYTQAAVFVWTFFNQELNNHIVSSTMQHLVRKQRLILTNNTTHVNKLPLHATTLNIQLQISWIFAILVYKCYRMATSTPVKRIKLLLIGIGRSKPVTPCKFLVAGS